MDLAKDMKTLIYKYLDTAEEATCVAQEELMDNKTTEQLIHFLDYLFFL